jgi:uncharacterized protein
MMKCMLTSALVAAAVATAALPASAKNFVQDNAQMFNSATVEQLNARISNFNRDTGKEIVVVTVPSAAGGDVRTAAENAFAQQSVNGVLIYVDKGDRRDYVVPDRAAVQAGWWNSQTSASVVAAMGSAFRAGDFDGGITNAVNTVFDVYRSHMGSLRGAQTQTSARGYAQQGASGGVHISVFWWIIIALFAFFIIRSLIRASRGAYYGGGYGGPGYGPGYGGPGYGPGYGGWGGGGWGGGGFWSGLLGGLGGAWLGNELFGGHGWGGGMQSGVDPGAAQQGTPDAGGWQADPGQADMSGGAGGDWGGGGWGDVGGGFGGGDMGGGFGGGGDAGGGW